MGRKKAKENTWRRVLWKQRDYDDSYVDETFMKDLKMNFYRSRLGYFVLVKESSCITQQLSLVILYMICFFDAMEEAVDPFTLLLLCLGIAVFLTTVSKMFVEEHKSRLMVTESISTAGLLFFVSPILRTLTEPWSDDTLTAMCLLFLVIHLASTDYSTKPRDEPIAVNAASFASVLLASRLPQYNYGFIMITLGVLLFTVSPEPRKALRTKVPEAWSAITWLLVGAAFAFLLNIDKAYAVLYCFVILSITFLIPAWLIHEHEVGKMQISGPWDEAKPTNSAAAAEWATAGLLT
eukprot:TRINITY_DN2401_c0_g1_i1.p2 TRINITY_DN2401_c0_g1~~TRINITY_DN2401_c0_g1_i1.p2  ORF type:complete len:294 (+),score=65.57 TRINITY_DN2401_c0_g1_i1:1147-2028(+)